MYKSVVISGPAASGTSTAAKTIAKKLNLEYKSTGDFFRLYHTEHNIPLANREDIPDELDQKIDKEFTELVQEKPGLVIDSLYAGYFNRNNPQILKVLTTADEKVRIQRALTRVHTHKETAQDVIKRDLENDKKFRKLYADENFLDPKFFDLVIDTTNTPPEEIASTIIKKFKS